MAARGREPGLTLERGDGARVEPGRVGGADRRARWRRWPQALDATLGGRAYREAWKCRVAQALGHADSLPSARVLATMHDDFDNSYVRFTRAQSVQTRNTLLGLPWTPALQQRFEAMARESVRSSSASKSAGHDALRDLPPGVPGAAAAGALTSARCACSAPAPLGSAVRRGAGLGAGRQTMRSPGWVILRIGS